MNESMAKVFFLSLLLWLLVPAARCQNRRQSPNNLTTKQDNGKRISVFFSSSASFIVLTKSLHVQVKVRYLYSQLFLQDYNEIKWRLFSWEKMTSGPKDN